jgi:hypothetical protein
LRLNGLEFYFAFSFFNGSLALFSLTELYRVNHAGALMYLCLHGSVFLLLLDYAVLVLHFAAFSGTRLIFCSGKRLS